MKKAIADCRMPSATLIPTDCYIFDIDGTLLNSRDAVHYFAFLAALREIFELESDLANVSVHGNTDPGILRAVLEREGRSAEFTPKLESALAVMRREAERNRSGFDPELCPSIARLLEHLYAEGKLLGVASGNLESIAWAKLEAAGIRHYFRFGSFSDQTELREHIFARAITKARALLAHPAKTICFVGDTPSDILAARANAAPIIAVATGIYSHDQLAERHPDQLLSCCSNLFAPQTV